MLEAVYTEAYEADLVVKSLPTPAGKDRPARSAGTGLRWDLQPTGTLRDTQTFTRQDEYAFPTTPRQPGPPKPQQLPVQ